MTRTEKTAEVARICDFIRYMRDTLEENKLWVESIDSPRYSQCLFDLGGLGYEANAYRELRARE